MQKIKVVENGGFGLAWIAGWLFTIGFFKLAFWPGVLAIIIWPYQIGAYFAGV